MRRLVIITDKEPKVKHLWNSWEFASGRIEGDHLTVKMRNKSVLTIKAIDPQMVADVVFSHDPTSEIITGKLGIESVCYEHHSENCLEATDQLIKALKTLLRDSEG